MLGTQCVWRGGGLLEPVLMSSIPILEIVVMLLNGKSSAPGLTVACSSSSKKGGHCKKFADSVNDDHQNIAHAVKVIMIEMIMTLLLIKMGSMASCVKGQMRLRHAVTSCHREYLKIKLNLVNMMAACLV